MAKPSSWLVGMMATLFVAIGCAETDVVATKSGLVSGISDDDINIFRGIPYAAPPVGDLRWRAPQPFPPWKGVRSAEEFGPACLQVERPGRPLELEQAEDCLTLNIWAPRGHSKPVPVMVWIHGGAFRLGSGSLPIYDGSSLARKGVLLVTFNYRLGRFGFFAHPELAQEQRTVYPDELLGNYGLMDQIQLLQWVKENIDAFGGDPNNVTIFGQSAGGASVNYLMASPLATGLFQQAISESGGGFQIAQGIDTALDDKPSLQEQGEKWTNSLGLEQVTATNIRAIPANRVLGDEAIETLGFGPVIDGTLIVDDVGKRFANGQIQPVPYLVGANNFESSLMEAIGMAPEEVYAWFGGRLQEVQDAYSSEGIERTEALAQTLYGDAIFVAPARHMANSVVKTGQPAWLYHFSYVPKVIRGKKKGASHGFEVPFVFGSLSKLPRSALWVRAADEAMSEQVMDYWVSFATSGNPNSDGNSVWPRYDLQKQKIMMFNNDGLSVVENPFREQLDTHQKYYEVRSDMKAN